MATSDESDLRLNLDTDASVSAEILVEGLYDWVEMGLLDAADLQATLWVARDHPALLSGLERLLARGILSDAAVRQLCAAQLTCAIAPTMASAPADDFLPFDRETRRQTLPVSPRGVHEGDRPVPSSGSPRWRPWRRSPAASQNESPTWLTHISQSLMAELSVLWVLLLGIALVVLSSGVIAAQQWQSVPPLGQYGILWMYTLIFGITGLWLTRRPGVQLTAQALQWVAILLLPVNMVALDRIQFARSAFNLGAGAIAVLLLSALVVLILRRSSPLPWPVVLAYLGLSYLHGHWVSDLWAIAAVYAGMGLTGGVMVGLARRAASEANARSWTMDSRLLAYGILVLLGRSLFVEQISVNALALAIGLYGTLVVWIAQQTGRHPVAESEPTQLLPVLSRPLTWEWVGGGLILLGWLIAVDDAPRQAIALSGLGLWFFGQRYRRFYAVADWLMLGLIGIQLHGLVWAALPDAWQQSLLRSLTQATETENTPWSLLGLAFLPFLALSLVLTVRVHRGRPTPTLLHWLLFGFGTVLVGLSFASPVTRSLNGLVSTLLLGSVTMRYVQQGGDSLALSETERSKSFEFTAKPLIYLTHLAAVLTLLACIDWVLPSLGRVPWATVVLTLALLEWGLCYGLAAQASSGDPRRILQASAWVLGLGLAIATYALLLNNAIVYTFTTGSTAESIAARQWGVLWLLIPAGLTLLGSRGQVPQHRSALWWSAAGLVAMPLLTVVAERWWLWSLAIATGLMIVNSLVLRRTLAAAIALGFAVALVGASLAQGVFGWPPVQGDGWLLVWVAIIAALWGLRYAARSRSGRLRRSYALAADGWAIALMVGTFLAFVDQALYDVGDVSNPLPLSLVALTGLIGAIAFRHWQGATHWTLVCLAIALELLVLNGMPQISTAPSALVVANVALGLGWVITGERQRGQSPLIASWNGIPLGFALLAVLFRLDQFAPWTGWTTLGIALILLGVGRRGETGKPLAYLGLAVFSVGAYEIALALAPTPWGDRLVIIAAVSVALIGLYRLGTRRLTTYLPLTLHAVQTGAHIHWGVGSVALIAAIPNPIESLSGLALLSGFLLTGYALEQGRHPQARSPDLWVYLGITEACGLVVYVVNRIVPSAVIDPLIPWIGAIAAGIASAFYLAPWETWGWAGRPWRRAAVVLPLGAIALTLSRVHPGSLLIAAACYTLLAQLRHQVRLTYLSIGLVNWAIARWVQDGALDRPMLYASLVGLSLIYLAQVEPLLNDPEQRPARHWVRCLGTGIICLFALMFHHETGLIPALVSLTAIFAGLIVRTRAFLYVGTIAFLLNAFYQLVILIFAYSLLKWIVGLLAGVALIWVAATFETRRDQVGTLLRQWVVDLRDWQ